MALQTLIFIDYFTVFLPGYSKSSFSKSLPRVWLLGERGFLAFISLLEIDTREEKRALETYFGTYKIGNIAVSLVLGFMKLC